MLDKTRGSSIELWYDWMPMAAPTLTTFCADAMIGDTRRRRRAESLGEDMPGIRARRAKRPLRVRVAAEAGHPMQAVLPA